MTKCPVFRHVLLCSCLATARLIARHTIGCSKCQTGTQTSGCTKWRRNNWTEWDDRLTMPLVVVIVPFASPPSRSSHGGSSVCVSGTSLLFERDLMTRVVLVTVVWTTPSASTRVSTTSVVSVSAYGSNSSKLACKSTSTRSVSTWSAPLSE